MTKIASKIKECSELISQQQEGILLKKEEIKQNKQEIINIKTRNESEGNIFKEDLTSMKASLHLGKSGNQRLTKKN